MEPREKLESVLFIKCKTFSTEVDRKILLFCLKQGEELALEASINSTKSRATFEQGREEDFNLEEVTLLEVSNKLVQGVTNHNEGFTKFSFFFIDCGRVSNFYLDSRVNFSFESK